MPSYKPVLKLDKPGNFGLSPEKSTDYFIESQQQEKLFVKSPNWDSPGSGIELLALQNEREHVQMVEFQEEMLENAKKQNIINSNRIDEVYSMQNDIQKRLIEANKIFKDCDDKKRFAKEKIIEEKQFQVELKKSIGIFKHNINVLSEFYENLKKLVKELEPYETVIDDVVASSDNNFSSVRDCMNKCDALMMTQDEVCELQNKKLQTIENVRLQMIKLTNEAKLTVLGLTNELSELEKNYAQIHSECIKLENLIGNTKDCINEHKFTTSRIIDEISVMYRLLCRRRGLSPILNKDDIEKQFNFIKDEIEIIRDVVKECLKE